MGAPEYNLTIKELPETERPREKLLKYGTEHLSNAELMAIIIRTGNQERTAIELSQDILNQFGGLKSLIDLSVEELKKIKGMGVAKGAQLRAVVELSKRLFATGDSNQVVIQSPRDVSNLLMPELRFCNQEIFREVLLDIQNQVIATPVVSKGDLSSSIVHPRDVFREAIRRSCAGIILVHNHPSGIPEPSDKDIQITHRLVKSGKVLGIEVLDHVIIGDGVYLSMQEQGLIQETERRSK